jgi:hypothetical protein
VFEKLKTSFIFISASKESNKLPGTISTKPSLGTGYRIQMIPMGKYVGKHGTVIDRE